jgi:uncharacterized membrane protein
MKQYIITLFFSLAIIISNAQNNSTLTGKILDAQNQQPLAGVSISIKNTSLGTISNEEGIFKLNLAEGKYQIQISLTGYQSTTYEVQINNNQNTELNISLK